MSHFCCVAGEDVLLAELRCIVFHALPAPGIYTTEQTLPLDKVVMQQTEIQMLTEHIVSYLATLNAPRSVYNHFATLTGKKENLWKWSKPVKRGRLWREKEGRWRRRRQYGFSKSAFESDNFFNFIDWQVNFTNSHTFLLLSSPTLRQRL